MQFFGWIEGILGLAGFVAALHALIRFRTTRLPQRFAVFSELFGGVVVLLSAAAYGISGGAFWALASAAIGFMLVGYGMLGYQTVLQVIRSTARLSAQTETEGERLHGFLATSHDPKAPASSDEPGA